jgi:hypothetical protein
LCRRVDAKAVLADDVCGFEPPVRRTIDDPIGFPERLKAAAHERERDADSRERDSACHRDAASDRSRFGNDDIEIVIGPRKQSAN